MKECEKCGESNDDDAVLCNICGEKFEDSTKEPPIQVKTAVYLLYFYFASLIVAYIINIFSIESSYRISYTRSAFINFGVVLLIVTLIQRRRNWARILFLILILDMLYGLITFRQDQPLNFMGVVDIVQYIMLIYATVLLFLPQSNKWFKKPQ